jgi:hypothetical protein
MLKYIRLIRLFLVNLGVFTLLVATTVIYHAGMFLWGQPHDAYFGVSLVALVLGVLLASGGTCLVFSGYKYGNQGA